MKDKSKIIYEDDAIVLLTKASGDLTIPDRHKPELFNLYGWLEGKFGKVFIVHRLDRETSGLLVFAKTQEAHKALSKQFEERTVEKVYQVLVEGIVHDKEGKIDKPIAKHPTKPGRMVATAKGKPSLTHYKVIEHFKDYTLLEADIKTGRTHQIRVHFKSIGYPLAVDAEYGRNDVFLLSKIKRKYNFGKEQEERPMMARTSLHSTRLVLDHPVTGERMAFEADLPKDFGAVLKQLRKWGKG